MIKNNNEIDINDIDIENISSLCEKEYLEDNGENVEGIDLLDNIILLDVNNLKSITFDNKKFKSGVDLMSEICGKITALTNVGISPTEALNYLSETEFGNKTLDTNLEITKINADIEKNNCVKIKESYEKAVL